MSNEIKETDKMQSYVFTIVMMGCGKNADEAWEDAANHVFDNMRQFATLTPLDYKVVRDLDYDDEEIRSSDEEE